MIDMDEQVRARWLWVLTGATAAYGLATVLVFYTTDAFGPGWLATSVLVYGVLLTSAIVLAFGDAGRPRPAQAQAKAAMAEDESRRTVGELQDHETLYATRTGRVLRAWFGTDDNQRSLLFAITGDDVFPVPGLENRLDAVSVDPPPIESMIDVEDALARRAESSGAIVPEPATVDVQLLEDEIVYANDEGRILRARYEADGEEHVRLFAIVEDEVVPVDEVDGSLDTLRVDELPVEVEAVFDEVISRRTKRETDSPPRQVIQR